MQHNLELPHRFFKLLARRAYGSSYGLTNAMKSGVNLESGDWQESLPEINLPRVVSSGQKIGEISPRHCRKWGLKPGVILVSGATDSNAAFYASGR